MFTIVVSIRGLHLKFTAASLALVANAFIWYLLAFKTLEGLLEGSNISGDKTLQLVFFGVNAGAIAVSALLGSFVIDKFKKRVPFLYLWTFAGVFVSLLPLALNNPSSSQLIAISLIFGAYFGLGMPVTMGYFSASINVEKRAKTGGVAFLLIGLIFFVIGLFVIGNLVVSCLILAAIRLSGLLIFRGLGGKEEPVQSTGSESYLRIISNRNFLLYFVPWIIFSLVNYMTIPIINQNTNFNFAFLSNTVENIVIAVVAVISGFLADIVGRKRLTIIGFIMLGMGFAGLSLFPPNISGYVYVFADGIAWGIFYVIFLLTIWGDLAQGKNSDKFYVLGAMPYLFSNFMLLLLQPILSDIKPQTEVFSFASVFLFLAILPLIYAPETLPEKLMKERELKSYVENAKKKAQKEAEKTHKNQKPNTAESEEESHESKDDQEYEDAMKLAEKYY
jgi:MFS family permease